MSGSNDDYTTVNQFKMTGMFETEKAMTSETLAILAATMEAKLIELGIPDEEHEEDLPFTISLMFVGTRKRKKRDGKRK